MMAICCRSYRSVLALALVIILPLSVVAAQPGGTYTPMAERFIAPPSHDSLHYAAVESIFLKFDPSGGDEPVAERLLGGGGATTVLRSDDAGGTSVGPRITFGQIDSDHRGWEMSYFGVGSGGDSRSVSGDDDLAMVGTLALSSLDFYKADQITLDKEIRMHSFEINRTWNQHRWNLLTGFRYLRVEDDFRLLSFDSDSSSFGNYQIDSENDLFGLQSGIRNKRRARLSENLFFDIGGKAGIYGNSASQAQSVIDFGGTNQPFPLRPRSTDHRGQVAFVGETNANARLALTPHIDLRAGYNLIWVDGLALASDQLELDDVPVVGISTSGGGLFHGASVGLMIHW
jgi:hypothetical protein